MGRYADLSARFRELAFRENRDLKCMKWRDPGELGSYLGGFGGRLKEDRLRRRGYLVCVLQEKTPMYPPTICEVPMAFAERVVALGGFP